MKNTCKFLLLLVLAIVFSFYMTDAVVAMANEEPEQSLDFVVEADTEQNTEFAAESESEQNIDLSLASEPAPDFVSSGPALIEWLEVHKETGGTVKLSDDVVLDGYYCYCPNGVNRPAVFVDTDKYTITVTGEIELLSDDHLTFSGRPDGKGIFYVAEKGALSMMGVAVESEQCALWQEEGAGLVIEDCHISGQIHYAETPFVIYQNPVCVVVEKGQTVNDVLPTEISCTVNRQGEISAHERVPLSWNLEGSEKQQAERLRFQMQGSFLQAASAEPALCTVAYNDYPLTFTDVKATDDGARYTFRGGYTKPEEALPITVISEYSFDGENWIVYDEANVNDIDAGFFIGFRSEERERAASPNIYIRLQWNDNGTQYFSNVLCYAAANLEHVEDIGGSRGGGTSIINPPDDPQKSGGEASSDTNPTESGDGDSGSNAASDGQAINAGALSNIEQSSYAESSNTNVDQPLYSDSKASNTDQPSYSIPNTDISVRYTDNIESDESINRSDSNISDKERVAVAAIFAKEDDVADLPQMKEQTLRPDIREGYAAFIATGFVLLSVLAGIACFCVHSRSGTNR